MIKHWAGYVDDILKVWSGCDGQVDLYRKETNAMNKDIKFIVEKGNNTINYLDLTLIVSSEGIGYKIYRKPTCTDTIIPRDSLHPLKHKMAAIENYCQRAMD